MDADKLLSRRDIRSKSQSLTAEFALLGLALVAGAAGMYFEDVRLVFGIFLGGLVGAFAWTLPSSLKGLRDKMAASAAKRSMPQSSIPVPRPDQVLSLIKARRSIYPKDYTGVKVDRSKIEQLLEAAMWAPTHNLTQPWRFVVLEGASKAQFESITLDCVAQYTQPAEKAASETERIKGKASKTWPLISHYIVVCMARVNSAKGKPNPEWEDVSSVACAVQNMALQATALGLAGYWSSWQEVARNAPEMAEFLGIKPEAGDKCLGVFSVGLADPERAAGYRGKRDAVETKVTWKQ